MATVPDETYARNGEQVAMWGRMFAKPSDPVDPVPVVFSSPRHGGEIEVHEDLRLSLDIAEALAARIIAAVLYERARPAVTELAIVLDEALAPYLERAEERKARETVLEGRLAELITADEPADGLAAFAERMRDAWMAEIEAAPIAPPEVSP